MGRIRIFVTNLGRYNEGCLMGEWVKLPIPEDKLQEVLDQGHLHVVELHLHAVEQRIVGGGAGAAYSGKFRTGPI